MGKVSLLFIVCLGLPQISHITHFTLRALLTYFACCCTVLARFIELCVCACGALFVCLCVCGGFAAGACCVLSVRLWWLWCWCVLCVACASVVALLLVRAVFCLCVCSGFAAGASA